MNDWTDYLPWVLCSPPVRRRRVAQDGPAEQRGPRRTSVGEIPERVTYDDIRPHLEASTSAAPLLGLAAAGGNPVRVDLAGRHPHLVAVAGAGAGKTALLRSVLAQGLSANGYGVILDVTHASHLWAADLPNVEYHRATEAIHNRLITLRSEIDRRIQLLEQQPGSAETVVGPRIWVLVEDAPATIDRLKRHWRMGKGPDDPPASPAVEALRDLLLVAERRVKLHVLVSGFGLPAELRSLRHQRFAIRCLTRYTATAWRAHVPEVWPMPTKPAKRGRWQIVIDGAVTTTQIAYLSPREARELATGIAFAAPPRHRLLRFWRWWRPRRAATRPVTAARARRRATEEE